ncbi:hypothetical protein [Ruminococcus flavefaciens]|uniref:hypothetical protein n=1 Tax=Ruminococcus flavefaciens TaxID=1265 RepID=UPI003F08E782
MNIDQTAHDLAVALTAQVQNIKNSVTTANVDGNMLRVDISSKEIVDYYCAFYDAISNELMKRKG